MIQTPWLFPEEHRQVVQRLYDFGLLKISNKRDLPLKSGGYTDVYINLRDARNNPEAIRFIAELFAIPLNRIRPDRFVEIPDSVSCFAGPLAIETRIPYLTIREQAKLGRVADAKVIGNPVQHEYVVMIDDVVTDGASKEAPYQECINRDLDIDVLVVAVDRQQGWKKRFADKGIKMNVWPGMTLHDVRRQLIELGKMQRCDPAVEKNNPIILALDGKNWDEILPTIDRLRTTGCILKVNDLLVGEGIEHLLPNLSVYGRVMADLKGHDIPNTVANICKHLRSCPPWAVTIHASGGPKMITAAREALAGTETKILAVTVLTSLDPKTCEEIYTRQPINQVLKLAEIADSAGADGFVCSPQEADTLRRKYPNKLLVTAGIRSAGKNANDQERIATPRNAIENGANHLVIGRQILESPDPVAEVNRIVAEELGITL